MADIKISALPTATTPLNGAELVPIVQSGVTKQTTTSDVLAAPVTSLTASSAVATDASKKLVSVTNTGTGDNVLATSPTLVTPILGTPQSVTLTNATGLPISTGVSGLGTGVATALAVNVGTAGSPVVNGGALGTPSSGTITNLTGTANITATGGASGAIAATTLSASSTVSGTGFSTYLASPPAIGGTAPAAASFTSLNTGQLAGLRNVIINGNMDVWQRGTSFTNPTTAAYTIDRYLTFRGANVTGLTTSQSTSVPSGFTYSAKFQRTAGDTSAQILYLIQAAELQNSTWFQNKYVTLSFWAKSGANQSYGNTLSVSVFTGTTGDQAANLIGAWGGNAAVISSAVALTGGATWTKYSVTSASPCGSTIKQIGVQINTAAFSGTAGADDSLFITGVQLEIGSVATPFEQRPYGMELALCQRYYQVLNSGTNSNENSGSGVAISTTAAQILSYLPTVMRASPTLTLSAVADFILITSTGTSAGAPSSITLPIANTRQVRIDVSGVTAALAAGNYTSLQAGSSSARLALTAEL